jgi:hypothetical protein
LTTYDEFLKKLAKEEEEEEELRVSSSSESSEEEDSFKQVKSRWQSAVRVQDMVVEAPKEESDSDGAIIAHTEALVSVSSISGDDSVSSESIVKKTNLQSMIVTEPTNHFNTVHAPHTKHVRKSRSLDMMCIEASTFTLDPLQKISLGIKDCQEYLNCGKPTHEPNVTHQKLLRKSRTQEILHSTTATYKKW